MSILVLSGGAAAVRDHTRAEARERGAAGEAHPARVGQERQEPNAVLLQRHDRPGVMGQASPAPRSDRPRSTTPAQCRRNAADAEHRREDMSAPVGGRREDVAVKVGHLHG